MWPTPLPRRSKTRSFLIANRTLSQEKDLIPFDPSEGFMLAVVVRALGYVCHPVVNWIVVDAPLLGGRASELLSLQE